MARNFHVARLVPVAATLLLLATTSDAHGLPDVQGTYRFDDGLCVTGGRFDESGSQRLLFTDTRGNRRGGLFEADGAGFRSIIDGSTRIAFGEDRTRLTWMAPQGTQVARLIHAPRRLDVLIDGDAGPIAATLYLPAREVPPPYPAIVLAHGSGPQNRHAGPWITDFVDLGLAVLSYDKRGVGASGGDLKRSTYADLARDLGRAVDWLAARPEVDARRIGIHASSQSGWYAPRVAAGNARVAFLVQRAAPALPTGATTLHEREEEWRAAGLPAPAIAAAATFWRGLMADGARGASREAAQRRLDEARAHPWFAAAFGDWTRVRAVWWLQEQRNARFHPAVDLARRPVPTLWFLADRDQNVPHAASVRALRDAGLADGILTLVSVEDADHGFLIRTPEGGIRYTDQYWPVMARWLRERGFAGHPTAASECSETASASPANMPGP